MRRLHLPYMCCISNELYPEPPCCGVVSQINQVANDQSLAGLQPETATGVAVPRRNELKVLKEGASVARQSRRTVLLL